ncbi:MAG: hypothetical protein KBT20_04545 [Bacteroidales bacterium]|nr:hypothetical protein [Candidatus Liminaster caballi]
MKKFLFSLCAASLAALSIAQSRSYEINHANTISTIANSSTQLLDSTVNYNSDDVRSSKTEYSYDDTGKLTLETRYSWKNNGWEKGLHIESTYDNNGKLVFTKSYSGNNKLESATEYIYNEDGNLKSEKSYFDESKLYGSSYEYEYDELGRKTSSVYILHQEYFDFGAREEYIYNDNGIWIQDVLSFMYSGTWEETPSATRYHIYDENGYEIRLDICDLKKGGYLEAIWEYTYDTNGNKICVTLTDFDNEANNSKSEYSYDSENLLSKATSYYWENASWIQSGYLLYYYSEHTVGISNTEKIITDSTPRKIIRGGKLYIENHGHLYNICGQTIE